MKVNFLPINPNNIYNAAKRSNLPFPKADTASFGSIRHYAANDKTFIDSEFFRDAKTLRKSAEYIKDFFPKGTTILDYGCSNGEEPLSLMMILKPVNMNGKYKIIGLDTDIEAEKLRQQGVYSVFDNAADKFILKEDKKLSYEERALKNLFKHYFVETNSPKRKINNTADFYFESRYFKNLKYFTLRNKNHPELTFAAPEISDIRKINELTSPKKAGAVFFRNGSYFLTGNNISEYLSFIRDNKYSPKVDMLEGLAEKIYDKLENKGIFVMGNNPKEHLFLAPENVPEEQTIKYSNIADYKIKRKQLEASKNFQSECLTPFYKLRERILDARYKERFLRKSPWEAALVKDGKFSPIYYGGLENDFCDIKVPLIWRKNS